MNKNGKRLFPTDKNIGFTLIELLVAIAIVGILVAFTLVSYKGAQKTGRDAKRKADLEQIKTAAKMYQQDSGTFPAISDTSIGSLVSCPTPSGDDWTIGTKALFEPKYFAKLPLDPRNDCSNYYAYKRDSSGLSFWVGGILENPGGSTCDLVSSGFTVPINYCLKAN